MTPSAYIIGLELNGLGVLRSLAPQGVNCVCIDTTANQAGMRSRYGRKVLFDTLSGSRFVEQIIDLARQEPTPPILFLTQEATVRTVSEHRMAIQAVCRIQLPEHNMLMSLMDKDRFHTLAVRYQAPLPRSLTLHNADDLKRLAELRFPCILKPAYKNYNYGTRFKKGYIVQDAAEVHRLYAEIAPVMAEMIVQEWIQGEDCDIYFCLQYRSKAGALASFVGRKLRSWPPKVGGTASCTVARQFQEKLIAATEDFFAAVGFIGMGGIEFKQDGPSDRLLMIEPTVARTDFQHEVATINGVNLPWIQFCDEAGLALPQSEILSEARIWREPVTDGWAEAITGSTWPPDLGPVRVVDAYWRWNDPCPGLEYEVLRERLKQGINKWLPMATSFGRVKLKG
ncbi:MAG: FAD-dependent oxidoreductase [Gammaproteobacteria bacterium]|nr:FAD-dependent oxidoreductase [Gammaproteobacteria bacterium]